MMTNYDSDVPIFYDPGAGWRYKDGIVTERRAAAICRKSGIPHRKPLDSDPEAWYPVLDTSVAGTYFIKDSEEAIQGLSCGDSLRMVREDNDHDPLAIALYTSDRKKIGYIPRKDNQVIARLMDVGDVFRCIIVSEPDADDVKISVSIKRGRKVRRHFSESFDSLSGKSVWIDVKPVTRDSMQFRPLSGNVREVRFRYPLSDDELWDLSWGYRSRSMDERWNFFMEGNRMYISRSWTGNCIFEVTLGADGEHRVLVENDEAICRVNDRSASMTLRNLFRSWTSPVCVADNAVPKDVFGNVETYEGAGYFGTDYETGTVWICSGSDRPLILKQP